MHGRKESNLPQRVLEARALADGASGFRHFRSIGSSLDRDDPRAAPSPSPRGARRHANNFCSSPLSISCCRSLAPPTKVPFTNTRGKVGHPTQIFSARRRRQPEK